MSAIDTIGKCLSQEWKSDLLSINTSAFEVQVSFVHENIVRIRACHFGNRKQAHSYATENRRSPIKSQFSESKQTLSLSSGSLKLDIQRDPVRFVLRDKRGQILIEDDSAFGISAVGTEVAAYHKLQPNEKFLGLGEKVGPLNKRGMAFTNWNTDKFGYSIEEDPLYLSIPFYIGQHDKGCYGVFLDNSHRSTFNFGASSDRFSWFSCVDGEMDIYLIGGKDIGQIVSNYTALTGRMHLPPKWSLGYQQCRYSYYPDDEVRTLAQTFREKDIPADVIYLDIHYMQDYKAFTFDMQRFPRPKKLMEEMDKQGFKLVCIVDPGIKREKGYGPYERGVQKDIFLKLPDGEHYAAEVWPSWSHFPDFTSEKGRSYWAKEIEFYFKRGVKGIWNDMNEPAAWGQSLPSLIKFDYEGNTTTHREGRNVYGMQMARATAEGMQRLMGTERNFVLTRAGFAGVQRYSAVWTGDNVSSDEHMLMSSTMLQGMGLSGISWAGNDIGGFVGEAEPELFARWIALGTFQPMYRAHTQVNTRDAEPWSFGEEVEQIARNYIKLRYALLPYIYSALWQSTQDGTPLMRAMAMEHAKEEEVFDQQYDTQYYFGPSLLIIPCTSKETLRKVFLPKGKWYDLYTDERRTSGEQVVDCPIHKLPVMVRAGAIIPMESSRSNVNEKNDAILRLHVYTGANGSFRFFEDDGLQTDSPQAIRDMELKGSTLVINAQKGKYVSDFKELKLYLHGLGAKRKAKINGKSAPISTEEFRFIRPISGIDTFYEDKGKELVIGSLVVINCRYIKSKMTIEW